MPFKDPIKKKEYDKQYRLAHLPERRIARMKSYKKNRAKEIKRQMEYAKKNPIIGLKSRLNYEEKHKDRLKMISLRKHAMIKGLETDTSENLINWYKNQEKICVYCGVDEDTVLKSDKHNKIGSGLQVDKMIPDNGYFVGNIVLACPICNYIKGRWFTPEIAREIGQKYVRNIYN